ncbi:hypothetical protein B0O80DRAFT_237982 [Mortierella sp. GBAus27b]|nr:hypothetical protein B0O80DRAFT_237982 [Mortierella sp. GBAus27b]
MDARADGKEARNRLSPTKWRTTTFSSRTQPRPRLAHSQTHAATYRSSIPSPECPSAPSGDSSRSPARGRHESLHAQAGRSKFSYPCFVLHPFAPTPLTFYILNLSCELPLPSAMQPLQGHCSCSSPSPLPPLPHPHPTSTLEFFKSQPWTRSTSFLCRHLSAHKWYFVSGHLATLATPKWNLGYDIEARLLAA